MQWLPDRIFYLIAGTVGVVVGMWVMRELVAIFGADGIYDLLYTAVLRLLGVEETGP